MTVARATTLRALAATLVLCLATAAGALAGCGDNPCVAARAKLCAADSPMRTGGICTRLRADGDHPDEDLKKKCALLLAETK